MLGRVPQLVPRIGCPRNLTVCLGRPPGWSACRTCVQWPGPGCGHIVPAAGRWWAPRGSIGTPPHHTYPRALIGLPPCPSPPAVLLGGRGGQDHPPARTPRSAGSLCNMCHHSQNSEVASALANLAPSPPAGEATALAAGALGSVVSSRELRTLFKRTLLCLHEPYRMPAHRPPRSGLHSFCFCLVVAGRA